MDTRRLVITSFSCLIYINIFGEQSVSYYYYRGLLFWSLVISKLGLLNPAPFRPPACEVCDLLI